MVKTKVRSMLCSSEPCPRNRTNPDYFNRRALGIRPRSLLWLARVTGFPASNHRRSALDANKKLSSSHKAVLFKQCVTKDPVKELTLHLLSFKTVKSDPDVEVSPDLKRV